jgi:two-component system sensor histidine kinase CiaH
MQLFQSARLRLTFWYVLIISLISLSFSAVIYRSVALELERGFMIAEYRLRGMPPPPHSIDIVLLKDELDEAKHTVLIRLFAVDGTIVLIGGALGYFLAGKTLKPIEGMVKEQRRFVADASHELKTPLTAMQTSVEVTLRDKKLNLKSAKKALKESLDDVEKLKKLANDLLSLARYKDNSLVKEIINVRDIVGGSHKNIMALAKNKKIKLTVKAEPVKLKANKESLEKLITILLDNAIKFTPKGGKVHLEAKKSKRHLVITAKDNGIGIAKKELPHVFDRFYQVDSARSSQENQGFGLGLSMAKKIAEDHKGSINVKSTQGKGSTFTVKLPLHL